MFLISSEINLLWKNCVENRHFYELFFPSVIRPRHIFCPHDRLTGIESQRHTSNCCMSTQYLQQNINGIDSKFGPEFCNAKIWQVVENEMHT